jgi:hypothetical protein
LRHASLTGEQPIHGLKVLPPLSHPIFDFSMLFPFLKKLALPDAPRTGHEAGSLEVVFFRAFWGGSPRRNRAAARVGF